MCDWNRTLFEDEYEIEFFRGLARCAGMSFLKQLKFQSLFRLYWAKKQCENMYQNTAHSTKNHSQFFFREILAILNHGFIRNLPNTVLTDYLPSYAKEATSRLDQRPIRPLMRSREDRGLKVGILSSGCGIAIKKTLEANKSGIDFIKANSFEEKNGRLQSFKLDIYDNKAEALKTFLEEMQILPNETMYIGDDWQDEECLRSVRYPVVSFLAHPEIRTHFKEEVKAYAPENEAEFSRFIETTIGY